MPPSSLEAFTFPLVNVRRKDNYKASTVPRFLLSPTLKAAVVYTDVAMLRLIYDNKKTKN